MVDKEKSKVTLSINPPNPDGTCSVCEKHVSQLKPFGGKGDPLNGDFSGALLVKMFRDIFPEETYPYSDEKGLYILVDAKRVSVDGYIDLDAWEEPMEHSPWKGNVTEVHPGEMKSELKEEFIRKNGKRAYRKLQKMMSMCHYGVGSTISASWECRDCILLDTYSAHYRKYKKFEVVTMNCCERNTNYFYSWGEINLEEYLRDNLHTGIALVSIKEVPNDV